MVDGTDYASPSAIFRMVPLRTLPDLRLGQTVDYHGLLERGHSADILANHLDDVAYDFVLGLGVHRI